MTNASAFPETRYSLVQCLSDDDPQTRRSAYDALVTAYWKPVYTYLRLFRRHDREDAEDLTQGFFAHALEREFLAKFDPKRARFRTWLRTCLDGFVTNEVKKASRQKRGGGTTAVPLDFETAEGELRHHEIPVEADVEAFFHREWVRGLVGRAVDALRDDASAKGRDLDFAIFERYDLDDADGGERPSYGDVARELDVSVSRVTNALHAMRRRLREHVLSELRCICATEDEFRRESSGIFGAFGR